MWISELNSALCKNINPADDLFFKVHLGKSGEFSCYSWCHKTNEIKNQITQSITNKTCQSVFCPSTRQLFHISLNSQILGCGIMPCDSYQTELSNRVPLIRSSSFSFSTSNITQLHWWVSAMLLVQPLSTKAVRWSRATLSTLHSRVMLFKHLRHSTKLCIS